MLKNKNTFRLSIVAVLMTMLFAGTGCAEKDAATKTNSPNVILIMTDDQGIGDFGFNGNPFVHTPTLDQLAKESTHFTRFYVNPVCAPTRASLMTGKYAQKTGIYDTYNGGAIMSTDQITIAEVLSENNYKTAIFGKWHLGDNYPFRPMDQGFTESLVLHAGGVGQPGDVQNYFAKDSSYFSPVLWRNGKKEKTKGYCSDVYTREAMKFIENNKENPFFVYLAFNAPHVPLQLPEEYYDMYRDISMEDFLKVSENNKSMQLNENDLESAKRVYGMVTNIDDNLKLLFDKLRSLNLMDNTIIFFLTDNGPQQNRYRMGYRGKKSDVFEGGIRVPLLVRYPSVFKPGEENNTITAHIDVFPTILDLLGIDSKYSEQTDGMSFLPVINGDTEKFDNRTLFWEWGRGYPVLYRNTAITQGNYKLVGHCDQDADITDFEFFNLADDPYEMNNLIQQETKRAIPMKKLLDGWFDELSSAEVNHRIQRAQVGTDHENPVELNRNDAKALHGPWTGSSLAFHWDISIMEDADYTVTANFYEEVPEGGQLTVRLYPYHFIEKMDAAGTKMKLEHLKLGKGDYMCEVFYQKNNGNYIFPFYVTIEKE